MPFVDLARQHAPIADELRAAFDRVLGASAFILGEEVVAFEDEFADYCGVAALRRRRLGHRSDLASR